MAAHLRSIEKNCVTCGGRATVQLFNTWNAPMSYYCRKDGEKAKKRLQQKEKETAKHHYSTETTKNGTTSQQ